MTTTYSASNAAFHFLEPGALAPHLDRFLRKLEAAGYSRLTRSGYRDSVAHFDAWMARRNVALDDIDEEVIARFARHRCACPGGRRQKRLSGKYIRRVRRFVRFLQTQGIVRIPDESTANPQAATLDVFCRWLMQQRGLKPNTVTTYLYALNRFLQTLGDDPARYSARTLRHAVLEHAKSNNAVQTKHLITSLRAYLRFLAATRRCPPELVTAVPTIPHWRLSSMPRYISADAVERLIASCDTECPVGIRDQAVLLLLARLGLRAGDIMRLQLDDIDWHEGTVRVMGKARRAVRLPLPQDAGDAILRYLERARPDVALTALFLCVGAPYRPFRCSSTVSNIVRAALMRTGIEAPSRGTHLLRHSAATAMLRAGATLDTVATVLRHRSTDTTAYYAKVDIPSLQGIAQPWPEGTSC